MYEIALSVAACLRAGTKVDVAWVVDASGLPPHDRGEALAITPGGGRVGSIFAGAVHDHLADLSTGGRVNRIVDLHVSDLDAQLAGLPRGGDARCVLLPASSLPPDLWDRLRERDPVGLVLRLDGDRITDVTMHSADVDTARRVSGSVVEPDRIVSVFRPVPRLVIAGRGPIAEALRANAALLGWHVDVLADGRTAAGAIAALAGLDKVVVIGHDADLTGAAIAAALDTGVGYIGSVGPQRVQQERADWLAYRGVTDLSRVYAPAGLGIGASTPAEIAVAVLAEAISTAVK